MKTYFDYEGIIKSKLLRCNKCVETESFQGI